MKCSFTHFFNHNIRLNSKCNLTPFYNHTHKMCNLEHDYKTFLEYVFKGNGGCGINYKIGNYCSEKINYKQ